MSPVRPVLGIDFDNTLVSYDELIHRVALERGLIRDEAKEPFVHLSLAFDVETVCESGVAGHCVDVGNSG